MKKVLLLFLCIFSLVSFQSSFSQSLELAQHDYQLGAQSNEYEVRQKAFNEALKLYSDNLQKQATASSYFAVAQLYEQMGYYAWALLNTERALLLGADFEQLQPFIYHVREKLGLTEHHIQIKKTPFPFLGFVFFVSIFCVFVFFILNQWIIHKALRRIKYLLLVSSFIIFTSLCFEFVTEPVIGMIVYPSGFYQQPADTSRVITPSLLVGDKVEILNKNKKTHWVKIKNKDDIFGFIPEQNIRLL